MPTELLIHREVTADRGQRFATTKDVVDLIKSLGLEKFTSRDIADKLALHPAEYQRVEYAARAAIYWLCSRGMARACGSVSRRTATAAHGKYPVTVYELCLADETCDVALLNRVFLKIGVIKVDVREVEENGYC